MVFPVFVAPLIVWGAIGVFTVAAALTLKVREKRRNKKFAKNVEPWPDDPPPWSPTPLQTETVTTDTTHSRAVKDRRPTPYPLFIPSISEDESDTESDETIFVMCDAVEGLPLSDATIPRSVSTGALPLAAGFTRRKSLAQSLDSRRGSSASMEDPVHPVLPSPIAQADNDAITLASMSTRAKLSRRLRRKVRPSVRFTQDNDVPDYREVLRSRRRSSMGNLRLSTTALLGTPVAARSPAESANPLEEIAEDDRLERASGSTDTV